MMVHQARFPARHGGRSFHRAVATRCQVSWSFECPP